MMKLVAFLVIVVVAIVPTQVKAQACHMREIDLCIALGTFHFHSNGLPTSDEAVDEWCETMKEVEDCMGNFTQKCMSPVQRELLGLMSGADDIYRQFCTAGSEVRSNYLVHGECLANGAETDEVKSEMKDLQVSIEQLFDVSFKQRFPLMCCSLRRFHVNLERITQQNCGAPAVDMLKNVMKMITTDVPDLICAKYDPASNECEAVLPAPGTPSKGPENKSQLGKLLDTVMSNM